MILANISLITNMLENQTGDSGALFGDSSALPQNQQRGLKAGGALLSASPSAEKTSEAGPAWTRMGYDENRNDQNHVGPPHGQIGPEE